MKIGCYGFDFVSANKGCEALTYSFLSIIQKLLPNEDITVYNFSYNTDYELVATTFSSMKFEVVRINLKSPSYWRKAFKILKECDFFFDATFGDGFSDIYSVKGNVKMDLIKQSVLWSKTPLILTPQTYGPFRKKLLEKWAMHIITRSKLAFSRDKLSSDYIYEKTGFKIPFTTDMAFRLPYDSKMFYIPSNKTKVGINVSSLLWDGKMQEENNFGLMVDYQKYIYSIIDWLLNEGKYEIHIIPHVINDEIYDSRENDYRPCELVKKKYKEKVILSPKFKTPIEAKSYISQMDVFIGARMHATIAAISTNVATIPFSYSRKFEGLYGNLGYPFVLSAMNIDTEQALETTKKWIQEKDILLNAGEKAVSSACKQIEEYESLLRKIFLETKNEYIKTGKKKV